MARPVTLPQQIQSAYGVNLISFAGIKGDGTGQTIGIYEEGYNPDFVNTYLNGNPGDGVNPAYSTSGLAVFDQTFGLPDPPSLTFVDHNGIPLSSTNNSSNNPDFDNYGAGDEIALDIEWRMRWLPGRVSSSSVPRLTRPTITTTYQKEWPHSPASPVFQWSRPAMG